MSYNDLKHLRGRKLTVNPERIRIIYTYLGTLPHVKEVCSGRKGDLNYLIRRLAGQKGCLKGLVRKRLKDSLLCICRYRQSSRMNCGSCKEHVNRIPSMLE